MDSHKKQTKVLGSRAQSIDCVTERRYGDATFSVASALPVVVCLALAAMLARFQSVDVAPLMCGSIYSVTVELWNWVTNTYEDLDWFEAELSIIGQVVEALEPYGGVSVEDVDGNDLDADNLPNPNTADGGFDCVISIDQDYYSTTRGFQWIRTRIQTHLDEILEDM
jgi:hypothetical protein